MTIFVTIVLIYFVETLNAYPTDLNSVELSFKKLESGESSGEIVNQCCQREPKYITVASGFNEGEVKLDIGQCRQKCAAPTAKPLKREEFDRYLKKFPDIDPIQIFLSLQSKDSTKPDLATTATTDDNNENSENQDGQANFKRISTSCLQSLCLPNSVKRESYYDLSGKVTEIDVIESCECLNPPQQGCQRYPSTVKIHVDTPYEREVDIGQCLGSCNDSASDNCLSCRPIRNRTTSLEGPNGAHCLTVIDECQCVGECYRVRQFLKVYDYTSALITKTNNIMNTLYNSSANNTTAIQNDDKNTSASAQLAHLIDNSSLEPVTKVIDVGMCTGSCSDVPLASKCLLWSNNNNGTCLSTLTARASCNANKFISHSYMDVHGKRHTIVSVIGCGCN